MHLTHTHGIHAYTHTCTHIKVLDPHWKQLVKVKMLDGPHAGDPDKEVKSYDWYHMEHTDTGKVRAEYTRTFPPHALKA